mgnify:CR=1 FL=1
MNHEENPVINAETTKEELLVEAGTNLLDRVRKLEKQNRELQSRNTELVEENRKLQEIIKEKHHD